MQGSDLGNIPEISRLPISHILKANGSVALAYCGDGRQAANHLYGVKQGMDFLCREMVAATDIEIDRRAC